MLERSAPWELTQFPWNIRSLCASSDICLSLPPVAGSRCLWWTLRVAVRLSKLYPSLVLCSDIAQSTAHYSFFLSFSLSLHPSPSFSLVLYLHLAFSLLKFSHLLLCETVMETDAAAESPHGGSELWLEWLAEELSISVVLKCTLPLQLLPLPSQSWALYRSCPGAGAEKLQSKDFCWLECL